MRAAKRACGLERGRSGTSGRGAATWSLSRRSSAGTASLVWSAEGHNTGVLSASASLIKASAVCATVPVGALAQPVSMNRTRGPPGSRRVGARVEDGVGDCENDGDRRHPQQRQPPGGSARRFSRFITAQGSSAAGRLPLLDAAASCGSLNHRQRQRAQERQDRQRQKALIAAPMRSLPDAGQMDVDGDEHPDARWSVRW